MNPPGRNDPCPCGSGRKYKRCCFAADQAASDPLPRSYRQAVWSKPNAAADLRRAAREFPEWELGAVACPVGFEDVPDARPVLTVVAAGDRVLNMDVLVRLGGEPVAVAEALADALAEAVHLAEAEPGEIVVRHEEVAGALEALLGERGDVPSVPVNTSRSLPGVEGAAREVLEEVAESTLWPPVSSPDVWGGWGLPGKAVDRLFRAAAAYYREAPWERFSDGDLLELRLPGGALWIASVLGNAGAVQGLALYRDPADLEALVRSDLSGGALPAPEGRVLALLFDEPSEVPRPMRREIARAGWEVAAPSAHPRLTPLNTPGGGVSRADTRALADALRAVAAYADALESGVGGAPDPWEDPETGVVVASPGSGMPGTEELDPSMFAELDRFMVRRWEEAWAAGPAPLRPAGPTGPASAPGARFDFGLDGLAIVRQRVEGDRELDRARRFEAWLLGEGFGEATARTHRLNAEDFLRFLSDLQGIPATAVHERDLREFLYDFHPRAYSGGESRRERVPVSLRRFFDYLKREEGIRCAWAAEVLEDRETFRFRAATFPGGPEDDTVREVWRTVLWRDLEERVMVPDHTALMDALREWGAAPGVPDDEIWELSRAELEEPENAHWLSGPSDDAEAFPFTGLLIERVSLMRELDRSWLVWREEVVEGAGIRDAAEARRILRERQRRWMQGARAEGKDAAAPAVRERPQGSERPLERVDFLTVESAEDLIVSFAMREPESGEIRSLTLLRTPRYEGLLPPEERGVSVSDEADLEDRTDLLELLELDGGRCRVGTRLDEYLLDVSRVDPGELRAATAVLRRMNFDGRFELRIS